MAPGDDPLGVVHAFVERAYVRMQAADTLTQCLDDGSTGPLYTLVESIVLVGPGGLSGLREVLEEVLARKKQLAQDRQDIYNKLTEDLKNYGVSITGDHSVSTLAWVTPAVFLVTLHQQGVTAERALMACLQLFQDTQSMLTTLGKHLVLLNECEEYLKDWLWGVIYQAARQELPQLNKMTDPVQ